MTTTDVSPPVPPHPWAAYVAPMATYLIATSLEGYLPRSGSGGGGIHPTYYPLAYAGKVALVAVLLLVGRSVWRPDLRVWPTRRGWRLAGVIGLVVTLGWVGLERLPYPRVPGMAGSRPAFDPGVLRPFARVAFLAVRFFGLVALVPLMEELFWRSFLMRLVIDPDSNFERVPAGQVTPVAGVVTAVLFAAAHPEWLPALLTGLAWAWLLARTGSLVACVASHAVANLGLGLYVLATGHWTLW